MILNGSKFAQEIPLLQVMTICLNLSPWLCKSHFFNPLVSPKQPYKLISLCCSKSDEIKDANTSKENKKLSQQSSWESQDSEGKDYLYRLGAEADNMNIAIGARAGVIDDLFTGNFLGKDSDIVFDYRKKVTRSFEYLQGDYYIAPIFMDKVGKATFNLC